MPYTPGPMSKHTPGPWGTATVNAGHEKVSVSCLGVIGPRIGASQPIIARMPAEYLPHHKSYEIAQANARLIAAAPELLEALRETLESLRVWQEQYDPDATDEVTDQTIRRGSLAIARAEGKE